MNEEQNIPPAVSAPAAAVCDEPGSSHATGEVQCTPPQVRSVAPRPNPQGEKTTAAYSALVGDAESQERTKFESQTCTTTRTKLSGLLRGSGPRIAGIILAVVLAVVIQRSLTTGARPVIAPPEARPVAVAKVIRQDLYNEVTIAAEFRPYQEVELHAKVAGYLDQINVDIGDRVKTGQVLATLEVPELKDELDRTVAARQKAEADYQDAHLAYTRLVAVNSQHPNLVAQQELDTAEAKDRDTAAAVAVAKAEVERYHVLMGYTRITAPFDGVITRRHADPGALIQAGTTSDTQSLSLVRLSDNYRLRLDFPVSVSYVKDIRVGDTLEVRVESLGGKTFTGSISRSAGKVDGETRTMVTEIEVPNSKLEIVPGMYATVVLKVERRPQVLAVPAGAVRVGKQPTVFVINHNSEIEERTVTLGIETPGSIEVLSGLQEGDVVMIGDRSQVKPGQKVEAKQI
jgi:RND family efflux transporter MFP subunit